MLLAAASDPESRRRLLVHADSVYAVAQAFTLNSLRASRLVEAVFRRAGEAVPPEIGGEKEWLLSLLRDELEAEDQAAGSTDGSASTDLRRRLATKALQRLIPAAFASLDPSERAMLLLVHVERCDVPAAARVLGASEDEGESLLRLADASLRSCLLRSMSESERALVPTLPSDWLRVALNDMVDNDLPAMPPTVRTDLSDGRPPDRAPSIRKKQAPRRRSAGAGAALKRGGTAVLIIFFAGLFAFAAARLLDRPPETSALVLAADMASQMKLDLVTDDPAEAERHVADRLNWRLSIPSIEGASLLGLQIRRVIDNAEVPVLFFHDEESGDPIAVVTFTYALLDRSTDRLRFEKATLAQIEQEGHFDLHDLGTEQLLVWRHRSNIFVAVTRGQAEALHDRIYPAS